MSIAAAENETKTRDGPRYLRRLVRRAMRPQIGDEFWNEAEGCSVFVTGLGERSYGQIVHTEIFQGREIRVNQCFIGYWRKLVKNSFKKPECVFRPANKMIGK